MSADPQNLPRTTAVPLGQYVVGAVALPNAAGFALGDGSLAVITEGEVRRVVVNDKGALLSLAAHDGTFMTGDDAGKVSRVGTDCAIEVVDQQKGKWIEHLAAHAAKKAFAFSHGKEITVIDGKGKRTLGPHPSTVAGIAFSPDGSRVAAAHYGGVSVWIHDRPEQAPRKLAWKGSHIAIAYAPNAKFIATSTQENALHVWRLANGADMQMRGYGTKPKTLAWTPDSLHLTSSATDSMTLWPFAGDGPEGKPPLEFGTRDGAFISVVAPHPKLKLILTGWEDGLITLADPTQRRATPLHRANGILSALAFDPTGTKALYGTEEGEAGIIELPLAGRSA